MNTDTHRQATDESRTWNTTGMIKIFKKGLTVPNSKNNYNLEGAELRLYKPDKLEAERKTESKWFEPGETINIKLINEWIQRYWTSRKHPKDLTLVLIFHYTNINKSEECKFRMTKFPEINIKPEDKIYDFDSPWELFAYRFMSCPRRMNIIADHLPEIVRCLQAITRDLQSHETPRQC